MLKLSDVKQMSDAELNYQLALALGWSPNDIYREESFKDFIEVFVDDVCTTRFSFKDPTVVWRVALQFDKMPRKEVRDGKIYWSVWMPDGPGTWTIEHESPERAVAMAVVMQVNGE